MRSSEEATGLLTRVARLAQAELFNHPTKETVLTSAVDYVTLGWTRMLQAALDSMPDERKAILPAFESLLTG